MNTPRRFECFFGVWMIRAAEIAILAMGSLFLVPRTVASVDWPKPILVEVTTNYFYLPTSITHAGDGSQRMFISERCGRIWILRGSNVLEQPFLDASDRIPCNSFNWGLLSVAFPPHFADKRHIYVCYVGPRGRSLVVSRFQLTADHNRADPNSEQVILAVPETYGGDNGGQIAFGPDGYLYVGVGDDGPLGDPLFNGQNTTTMLGKILRLDVESGESPYAVPPTNPFIGNTNFLPQIWAYGIRDPLRFSFDRLTGDFYLGDVGLHLYEEIDFVPAGSPRGNNFGWPIREGTTNKTVPAGFTSFSSLTEPIFAYAHLNRPRFTSELVTGGYVYRGPNQPRMDGVYFYADFGSGLMWGLKRDGTNWTNALLLQFNGLPVIPASTFGEDEQGRLYMVDPNWGAIYEIKDSFQAWTPKFLPANGFISSNSVTVICATVGASIRYTTNGLDPTIDDPELPNSGILPVASGATNKIRAFRSDLLPSDVATGLFIYRVGTPYFSAPQGPITNKTIVTLADVTPGATIYFTTDGTQPTTNSPVYSSSSLKKSREG